MSLLNSMPDAVIEDKEQIEADFIAFLHDLDYPEGSLFRGPSFQFKLREKWRSLFQRWSGKSVGNPSGKLFSCYADLGILELETCQYAALIEFRLKLDGQTGSRLATMFEVILDCVPARPQIFLVAPGFNAGFRIFQLVENGRWQEVPRKHFPRYSTLAAGFTAEKTLYREFNQARNLRRFTLTCRLLASAVGIIALCSIVGLSPLTAGQISLLMLAALLLVAPDAINFRFANSQGKAKPTTIK
jgi:hypothetical protein